MLYNLGFGFRTARGEKMGTALSFVNEKEKDQLEEVEQHLVGGE